MATSTLREPDVTTPIGMSGLPCFFGHFVAGSFSVIVRGSPRYYLWIFGLFAVLAHGIWEYRQQLLHGLITTGMRDPLSWGFYIGNFAYLVGVAAAAVVLVVPA